MYFKYRRNFKYNYIRKPVGSYEFYSRDIGPGNCLIDSWVRKNSKYKFDKDGILASREKEMILF